MKINVKNEKKIHAAIEKAEGGRVSARTIDYADIQHAVKKIETRLHTLLRKSDWTGLQFTVDPNAQSFPGAYRGLPESTQFRLLRGSSAWFVTIIGRGGCYGPSEQIQPLNINERSVEITEFVQQSKNWSN